MAIPILISLCVATSAFGWEDQTEMEDSLLYRNSFIYAPPPSTKIPRRAYVESPLLGYYEHFHFDKNFLTWAPEETFEPQEGATWASCTEKAHSEPCPEADIVGFHTVRHGVKHGPISALRVGGAFIGTVCGNFTASGGTGPIPTITGVKYEDRNADGSQDNGDPGLAGWRIKLRYEGNVVAETTTGADGRYTFQLDADHLPVGEGTYQVEEVKQEGWHASQTPAPFHISLGAGGEEFAGKDFGNYRDATISGHKFDDSNVDGAWEQPLESGIEGWTIDLSNGESKLTLLDGGYSFNVKPGTYTVSEESRTGWRQTTPGGSGQRTYTVQSGEVAEGGDFGNVCLGGVLAQPVDDSTGQPISDVEERLEQISVPGILNNEPPLPRSALSPQSFGELLPGIYKLTAFLPEGLYTTEGAIPVDGRFAIVKDVTVQECHTTAVPLHIFSESTPGKVTGGGLKLAVPRGFATGGFVFMSRGHSTSGTLQYDDHTRSLDLHTSTIEALHVSGDVAYVWGKTEAEGTLQRFELRLLDAGEPGTEDQFEIWLAHGYEAGQGETLNAGNIQIH